MKSLACLMLAATMALLSPPAWAQPGAGTIVDDPAALQRLRRNSGITLQWISFESARRGQLRVSERHGRVHLSGRQTGRGGAVVDLDGDVLSIGARSFTFRGVIRIENTPDAGRRCVRDGTYEFRATGRRRYWRLQNIEACDGLADYVDIYF